MTFENLDEDSYDFNFYFATEFSFGFIQKSVISILIIGLSFCNLNHFIVTSLTQ